MDEHEFLEYLNRHVHEGLEVYIAENAAFFVQAGEGTPLATPSASRTW